MALLSAGQGRTTLRSDGTKDTPEVRQRTVYGNATDT